METKANYVAVGAFVLACMVGLVVTVLWLANTGSAVYSYYIVKVEGSVTGVGKGTIVRYNGIEAGRVVDFAIDRDDPKTVIVSITVDKTYDIATDATAAIASQGLTGGSYIEVLGGSVGAAKLRHDPSKQMFKEGTTDANPAIPWVKGKFDAVLDKLDRISTTLDTKVLTPENIENIREILGSIKDITKNLDASGPDIKKTLANLPVLTATATNAAHDIDVAALALPSTLNRASTTLADLDKLTKHADQVVTGDGVAQLGVLVADARRLVTSLTKLSDELNREPTRVIFGDRRKGYTPK